MRRRREERGSGGSVWGRRTHEDMGTPVCPDMRTEDYVVTFLQIQKAHVHISMTHIIHTPFRAP